MSAKRRFPTLSVQQLLLMSITITDQKLLFPVDFDNFIKIKIFYFLILLLVFTKIQFNLTTH